MHPSASIPLRRQSVPIPDPPHNAYPSPHVPQKHLQGAARPSYPSLGIAPNPQPPDSWGSPYSGHSIASASPQYTAPEPPEMMAATQIQARQYHLYTPQSHSPVSTVSSHGQEQPNQRLYSQPPPLQQNMYYNPFPINHLPPQQPHQMMTPPQSVVPQHQSQPPLPPHSSAPMHAPAVSHSPRPQMKYEHGPRPLDPNGVTSQLTSNQNPGRTGSQNGNTTPSSHLGPNGNPASAPGPIPATTPLVVRQDHSGVQWIMFEYSRDRVKMEYTIRCDVESVNVDELSKEFKEANCVYPRAFCDKDQYTGNRQAYETECNTVGWSLVKLNPHLQEKRGLIQRAVDSWRNSNQDSRLRSRRVRRQNKQNTRNKNQQNQQASAAPRDSSTPSSVMLQQRPLPSTIASSNPPLPQHQQSTDSSIPNQANNLPLGGPFDSHNPPLKREYQQRPQIRPSNVFQGYPSPFPIHNTSNGSIPPLIPNGLDPNLGPQPTSTTARPHLIMTESSSAPLSLNIAISPPSAHNDSVDPYPRIPGRKFIHVHDPGHSPNKVRVKLDLNEVKINEVVDDFRERNSVYPRSCVRAQMQMNADEKRQKRLKARFVESDLVLGEGFDTGRTMVKIPTSEGDVEAPVPRLGKRTSEREERLNDAGYRIGWEQIQKYDRRIIFLQRSLDAWRKKTSELSVETSSIVPAMTFRPGKKAWVAQHTSRTTGHALELGQM